MYNYEGILNGLNIRYKIGTGGKGKELKLNCPSCGGHDKLWINSQTGKGLCYKCHWIPGNAFALVKAFTTLSDYDIRVFLLEYESGIALQETGAVFREKVSDFLKQLEKPSSSFPFQLQSEDDISIPSEPLTLPQYFYPLGHKFIPMITTYALNRGFPFETMYNLGFGGCLTGKYGGCLIMPAFMNTDLLFWQARDAYNRPLPRYRTPEGYSSSNSLFNIDKATTFDEVIICEGIFSALRVGEDAVATFGNKISAHQIQLLKKRNISKVVLCYDPDTWEIPNSLKEQGKSTTLPIISAFRNLVNYFQVRVVRLLHKDPDDTGHEAMRDYISKAPIIASEAALLALKVTET